MMGSYSAVGVLTLVAFANASTGDNSLDSGERVVMVSPVLAPPQDSKIHSTVRARQFPILVLLARRNPSEYAREPQAKSLQRNPQPIYVQKLEDQESQDQATPEARRVNRQKRHLLKKHLGISFGGGGGGGGCNTCGYQQPVAYYQPQPVYQHPQPVYQQPVYQQPSQTIVVIKEKRKRKYGHGGCGGGGCGGGHYVQSNPCENGGCGGGHYVQSNPCGNGGCGGGHYVQSNPCGNGGCGGGGHYGGGSPCSSGNCGGGGGGGSGYASATATATASASAQSGGYGKK